MNLLDLSALTAETFAASIGQTFDAVFTDGRLTLTLAEVRPLNSAQLPGTRGPFALTFHGRAGLRLPQHIYHLENGALGAMEVFLVQIAGDADASKFEVIFN
jgi:hypothetical protein